MTARTERGEGPFFHALSALVFTAACAWLGAALYGKLTAPAPSAPEAAPVGIGFHALVLRRELVLPPAAAPAGAREGDRLSAAETGTESALFFLGCDGLEQLSPLDAETLTPGKLDRLSSLSPAPADEAAPRLVFGWDVYLAAGLDGGAAPAPGPCRVTIGSVGEFRACLLTADTDADGRTALLLRVTEVPEALYRLRFVEGTIAGE